MKHMIFGSGGFAKEIDFLLFDLHQHFDGNFKVDFFVSKEGVGQIINGVKVINDDQFLEVISVENCFCYLAIGSPELRLKIEGQLAKFDNCIYPTLVHPSVCRDKRTDRVRIGTGTVICAGNILTTDIQIGRFVQINLDCTIGHDTVIGDFTTISPGCHISGNVSIGSQVFLGTGVVVLERVFICDGAIVGAGSVVNKSITEKGTYVGVPAKKIR